MYVLCFRSFVILRWLLWRFCCQLLGCRLFTLIIKNWNALNWIVIVYIIIIIIIIIIQLFWCRDAFVMCPLLLRLKWRICGSLTYRQIFTATTARSARQFEVLNDLETKLSRLHLMSPTVNRPIQSYTRSEASASICLLYCCVAWKWPKHVVRVRDKRISEHLWHSIGLIIIGDVN